MNDEIYSTPKLVMDGEGDGIKHVAARKRTPVPSSKKFNARTPLDEKMRIRLEKELKEMTESRPRTKSHCCLNKASSVAEITPSKSKQKRNRSTPKILRLNLSDAEDSLNASEVTLHATPRPLDAALTDSLSPTSRRCTRDWAACKVYGRLLLRAWRRYKERVQTLTETNGRQKNQINQLEVQVDFLKNMRNSECEKRTEALNECQKLRKKIENLELTKTELLQEIDNIREQLANAEKNLRLVKNDLKKCSEHLSKDQDLLKKGNEEKINLLAKLNTQEQEIYNQNARIVDLEDALNIETNNLNNLEYNYKNKQQEYEDIYQQLKCEMKVNETLKNELSALQTTKMYLEQRSKNLEDELESYVAHVEELKEENVSIRMDLEQVTQTLSMEKKKTWYKNSKDLALLSLSALQKIAEVVLPVYHKY